MRKKYPHINEGLGPLGQLQQVTCSFTAKALVLPSMSKDFFVFIMA